MRKRTCSETPGGIVSATPWCQIEVLPRQAEGSDSTRFAAHWSEAHVVESTGPRPGYCPMKFKSDVGVESLIDDGVARPRRSSCLVICFEDEVIGVGLMLYDSGA